MGGSSTTQTDSASQSINEIPQWVQNAGQQNYAVAQDVASQPLQQYAGQLVADVSPQEQQAFNMAANSGSVGVGAQSAGQAALMSGAGYTPQQVTAALANPALGTANLGTAAQLSNQNLAPYMNPYTQSVINATLPVMQQNLALSQNQQQNAANSANAYGGSRQAIQQGVTQAQGAMGMGEMAAGLNQANYTQAQQAALSDVNAQNQFGLANMGALNTQELANQQAQQQAGLSNQAALNAAQQANQNAGLTANSQGIAAGSALGTLGGQQVQNNLAQYGMLTSAGALEQQQQQNDINAQIAQFQQAQTYPQTELGILESSLGMTPYNTGTSGTSSSTQTTQTSNPAAIATGAMGMLGDLFSGSTAAGGLFAGGSDRRLKTDIKKIGMHHTGIPVYSFRYKGDPKSYPKVVGPMAEDVMKIAPHAVRSVDTKGHVGIHMPTLDLLRATPPSSPGVAKMTSMLGARGPQPRGVLASGATPPTRSLASMVLKPRVMGALGG
jgi:hypothetical protein